MSTALRLLRLGLCSTLMLLVSPVAAEDRRPDRALLTVMTLNAQWLWDGIAPEEGGGSFPWKGKPAPALTHMQAVAALIQAENPDVISLEEVENEEALRRFASIFPAALGYRPYFVHGTDTTTGQDVALLTRIDPEAQLLARDDGSAPSPSGNRTVSKNQWALLTAGDLRFALIGIHLLGSPNEPRLVPEREAQALVIRRHAVELRQRGYPVLILGTVNDYDGSPEALDHKGSQPRSRVLAWLRAMDPGTADDDLANVTAWIPRSERYTAWDDLFIDGKVAPNELAGIDHILLSPELAARVVDAQIPKHDPTAVTDHFPVVVRLRTGTGPPAALTPPVRILALLPDPVGDETQHEAVTIWNSGPEPVRLTGWTVRNAAGRTWSLDGMQTLPPGEAKTMERNGFPMALNNAGDTIALVDGEGVVVHTVTYRSSEPGKRILTP